MQPIQGLPVATCRDERRRKGPSYFPHCHGYSSIATPLVSFVGCRHRFNAGFLSNSSPLLEMVACVTQGYREDSVLVRPEMKHFTLK